MTHCIACGRPIFKIILRGFPARYRWSHRSWRDLTHAAIERGES